MVNTGKWIARHRKLIIAISFLLLIPSVMGYLSTRVNYDVLSYLPKSLETVKGQDILVDDFGMGAFSMIIVEDKDMKNVQKLKEKIEKVDHVKDVLWYDNLADISVPVEMLPKQLKDAFFKGDATVLIALFDDTTSADNTMDAVAQIRKIVSKNVYISGMSGVVTDIKALALGEMPIYVAIAAILSLIALCLVMDYLAVPFIFLFSIGIAIIYNMGTNVFMGQISYITQALAAVLQLGVTMDYSIFLLNSYEENKKRYPGENNRAMGHAIANTFKAVVSSSVTTVAGFIALCFMTFTLGMDIGIVMAKGVVIGVICCVTLLPSLILVCDPIIEKSKHKSLLPNFDKMSAWIMKHYKLFIILAIILVVPAVYGDNHKKVYFNIDASLPKDLPSTVANEKLEKEFGMNAVHMIMLQKGMSSNEKSQMLKEIKKVDGVKWAIGMDSIVGPAIPEDMIPKKIRNKLSSDNYELQFVASKYRTATEEVNKQVDEIQKIVKKYSPKSMVIGEAPLTKDLKEVTDVDLRNVSVASIVAIFIIIMIAFKSISIPIILVSVIELAISINMGIPYYTGTTLPFVAGIVIGTIQLGATVDYAILLTSRYQKERGLGKDKIEAIRIAHKHSMKSILISGCSFFAATFGVAVYSKVDMISSLCTLLSRGAVISTIVVLTVLPAAFMIFDPIICKTSIGFGPKKIKKNK